MIKLDLKKTRPGSESKIGINDLELSNQKIPDPQYGIINFVTIHGYR